MQDFEGVRGGVSATKAKFDESKLLPEQKKALALAKAQGVKPIRSIKELQLDIEPAELESFADSLEEQRQQARLQPIKNKF
jgi:hypothetical protein